MSTTIITVIAAVIDMENMILYKDDGDTYTIPQGDPRVQKILDKHLADLEMKKPVKVDLYELNHYREMEENTSGLVRFFKTTKRANEAQESSKWNLEAFCGRFRSRKKPPRYPQEPQK